jgi:DNA-binding transcriptional regulator YiaG
MTRRSWAQFVYAIRGDDTQEVFCRHVGCTVTTLSRWENGHHIPTVLAHIEKLNKLARARGITREM